jgi:hypothetical protein
MSCCITVWKAGRIMLSIEATALASPDEQICLIMAASVSKM